MTSVEENLKKVRDSMAAAMADSVLGPRDVTLVAVSKTKPQEAVLEAYEAGQRVFGENKVQEAQAKFAELREEKPDIELHLIGPLQTNKARDAVDLFDVIQSVDRPKLVRELAKEMARLGKRPKCFVQVNTGEEPQKAGVLPKELPDLLALCREQEIPVVGLMCIPPVEEEPSLHFAFLAKLAKQHGLEELSMGMSGDYELALRYGATHIRVGSSIFGERDYAV